MHGVFYISRIAEYSLNIEESHFPPVFLVLEEEDGVVIIIFLNNLKAIKSPE